MNELEKAIKERLIKEWAPRRNELGLKGLISMAAGAAAHVQSEVDDLHDQVASLNTSLDTANHHHDDHHNEHQSSHHEVSEGLLPPGPGGMPLEGESEAEGDTTDESGAGTGSSQV